MKKYFLLFLLFYSVQIVFGQSEKLNNEFVFSIIRDKKQILYKGDNNYITIGLKAKKIKRLDNQVEQKPINQNFLEIDGHIVGFSIIDIPKDNLAGLNVYDLSEIEQDKILNNYIEYELNYFETELNLKIYNYLLQKRYYKSKSYYVSSFKNFVLENATDTEIVSKNAKGQVYLFSIQLNKILVINIPVFEDEKFDEATLLIKGFVKNIKSFNKKYK